MMSTLCTRKKEEEGSLWTKLWWNGPWMAPFQNCVRRPRLPTKMAAKLKIEKGGWNFNTVVSNHVNSDHVPSFSCLDFWTNRQATSGVYASITVTTSAYHSRRCGIISNCNMETPRKPLNKYWCSVPHYLSWYQKYIHKGRSFSFDDADSRK